MSDQTKKISSLDWMLLGILSISSVIAVGMVNLAPRDAREGIAVLFAPWTGSADAISQAVSAGAVVVRVGRYPFIVIVRPTEPNYTYRIVSKGAWAVLDPQILGGCLSRSSPSS